MTISSSTLGLVYGSSWGTAAVSSAQASMDSALMAGMTYGQSGLATGGLESQLLNLSFTDATGTSMFDVLGAYYGAGTGLSAMLGSYTEALEEAAAAVE